MSLFKIRRDRDSYAAPTVKLAVSALAALAAKAGELVVNSNFDGKYDMIARVAFCVIAAVCAILCYQALMEIGFVYDRRHPNAAASVGAVDMTVDDVMDAVESAANVRVAILSGDETHVVGVRAKSASGEDFTRSYFADSNELDGPEALRERLLEMSKDGVLNVGAVGDLTAKKYVRRLGKGNE